MSANQKNYFYIGVTELIILSILKKGDAYVYDIENTIQDISNGTFPISQNSIYAATYKLVREKKITEYSKLVGKKRTRVYYHIQDEGLEYLNVLLNNYKQSINCIGNLLDTLLGEWK